MASFPQSKEEALINAVESRPTLFDKSQRNYSNRDVVGKLWLEVAEEIDFDGKFSINLRRFRSTFGVGLLVDTETKPKSPRNSPQTSRNFPKTSLSETSQKPPESFPKPH